MGRRLDQERQARLEPSRKEYAKDQLNRVGIQDIEETDTSLKFYYKGSQVTLFVYTGWHTGKTIKDGRGIKNLINQLV